MFEKYIEDNSGPDGWLSGGSQPGALDIHCYVIFERLVCLELTPYKYGFDKLHLKTAAPRMMRYVHHFREHPALKQNVTDTEVWSKQIELQLEMPEGVKKPLTIPGVLI